jgi:FkbM family methyltransferase
MAERQPLPTAPARRYRSRSLMDAAGERLRGLPLGARLRRWGRTAYHAAWMLQTAGRGLSCTLPSGELVRVLPEHRYLSWNPVEYAAFRGAVRPGYVALDVGANVGAYSVLLGQWVGASGRVFAFEPSPGTFRGLVRHIALNGQSGVVRPIAAAVADRDGAADLLVADTAGESRLKAPTLKGSASTVGVERGTTIRVPTVSIDSFCAREGVQPSFIKIDVEGSEVAVLRGARETIRRGGDGLALFVELHPSIWPLAGTARAGLDSELARQGLNVEPLTSDDPWSVEGIVVRLVPR